MTTVAIIAEYNPFHSGHKYQIEKIREEFGSDTRIIAIMSGNYTQRGEIAFASKGLRAKCAILCGINLVLELPFPFSSSSAEFFAKSGIKIADSLGIVDYLSFGSESGDINKLIRAAEVLSSDEYNKAFKKVSDDKSLGYPERVEAAYRCITGDNDLAFTSNNILALEYIKALKSSGSKIKPHTIKRMGADYDSCELSETLNHQSALAIRSAIKENDFSVFEYLPESAREFWLSIKNDGEFPSDISKISSALISFLRLNPPMQNETFHDANDGLYNRLYNASFEANDISSLMLLSETKNYTKARIRRAMLNSFFGVTSSELKLLPCYTQVLAMDKIGMQLLKNSRKSDDFKILTKPSNFENFDEIQTRQKNLSDKADSIFELTKPIPKHGKSSLIFTPYIKK